MSRECGTDLAAEATRTDERGFSLVEVIVASVIAIIAVVGLAHSFGMGRALIDRHENARDALALAQQRIEYLLNRPPAHADLNPGTHDMGTVALNAAVNGTERWEVVWVDDPVNGTGNDYKRITVTIAWTQGGIPDRIQLSRIVVFQ